MQRWILLAIAGRESHAPPNEREHAQVAELAQQAHFAFRGRVLARSARIVLRCMESSRFAGGNRIFLHGACNADTRLLR